MKKLLKILQQILLFIISFFIVYIWTSYSKLKITLCLIISSFSSLIFCILTTRLKKKNNIKESLKQKEKEDADNIFLSLCTNKNYLDFFLQLVSTRHKNIEKHKNYIFIKDSQKILYPFISMDNPTENDINFIFKETKKKGKFSIIILCNNYSKEILKYANLIFEDVNILNKYEAYNFIYKEYDFFPPITITNKETKLTIKDLISFAFNKQRTKGFLLSAIILLLSSLFIKINIYYCIVSTLLLLFALLSYINPIFNKKTEKISL